MRGSRIRDKLLDSPHRHPGSKGNSLLTLYILTQTPDRVPTECGPPPRRDLPNNFCPVQRSASNHPCPWSNQWPCQIIPPRSEEHTSELQSHVNLVCRLLLE